MEASLALPFRSVRPRLRRAPTTSVVTCGLRNSTRRPLWRSDVLSTEAIQAVQSLKLAKSAPRLNHVLSTTLSRLLKSDLLNAFAELKRQNEVDLALKVFEYVCKEEWYQTDLSLRCDVIQLLGKNKMVALAEVVFSGLLKEGIEGDTRAYAEMIGAYLTADMIEKAMQTYEKMKAAGRTPNEFTLMILIRNLEKAGERELVEFVKRDCVEYLDSPKKFLEEVERKYVGIHSSILIPALCSIYAYLSAWASLCSFLSLTALGLLFDINAHVSWMLSGDEFSLGPVIIAQK